MADNRDPFVVPTGAVYACFLIPVQTLEANILVSYAELIICYHENTFDLRKFDLLYLSITIQSSSSIFQHLYL